MRSVWQYWPPSVHHAAPCSGVLDQIELPAYLRSPQRRDRDTVFPRHAGAKLVDGAAEAIEERGQNGPVHEEIFSAVQR